MAYISTQTLTNNHAERDAAKQRNVRLLKLIEEGKIESLKEFQALSVDEIITRLAAAIKSEYHLPASTDEKKEANFIRTTKIDTYKTLLRNKKVYLESIEKVRQLNKVSS